MTAPLTVACVRTGTKYGADYVARLRDGVARHLDRPHRFVCLTDRPARETPPGVEHLEVRGLPGWWAKMALFSTDLRDEAGGGRWLFLDLDTVVVGDLAPLADLRADFGICANFARAAGATQWPCRYGSCVMTFAEGWGDSVWRAFIGNHLRLMAECRYGDQQAIERLVPAGQVALLQAALPEGFFLYKKDLPRHPDAPPAGAALVIFGGRVKPDSCGLPWVQDAWNLRRAA